MKNINEITKVEDLIVALENVKNEEELNIVVANIDADLKEKYEEELEVILDDFAFDADFMYAFGAKKWDADSDFEFNKEGYGDYVNCEATLREILENEFEWDEEWNTVSQRKIAVAQRLNVDVDNVEASLSWDALVPVDYETKIEPNFGACGNVEAPVVYDNVVVFGELLGEGNNKNLFFAVAIEDEEQAQNVAKKLELDEEQEDYLLNLSF